MPRHPHLFIPGATYHVYYRVARGEFVFNDDHEAIEFVETVREVRDLDGWSVLAWCLMGNHYHLVVKTRNVDLWRSMARLQGRFSRAHNRRHRYLGRLWQSRYRARVVDTNEYYRQVIAYVHLNPVSAGIANDPGDYVHSGHREIIGACNPHLIDLRSAAGMGATGRIDSCMGATPAIPSRNRRGPHRHVSGLETIGEDLERRHFHLRGEEHRSPVGGQRISGHHQLGVAGESD